VKLTTKSEYALVGLIYIARRDRDDFVKAEEICGKYGISKKYLEQILFPLKRAGYIRARRGAAGGYKLAMPADRISVAEVIRLMDGALAPTVAVSKYFHSYTPLEKEKKIMKAFKEIRDYVSNKVEKLKILDLL